MVEEGVVRFMVRYAPLCYAMYSFPPTLCMHTPNLKANGFVFSSRIVALCETASGWFDLFDDLHHMEMFVN